MSFGSLVFTPLVKKLQERYGSRRQYERMENSGATQDRLTEFETEFLAQRDSFYMATTGATGWPYVQHRGGPKGFLKVIDDHTLAFGDLRIIQARIINRTRFDGACNQRGTGDDEQRRHDGGAGMAGHLHHQYDSRERALRGGRQDCTGAQHRE